MAPYSAVVERVVHRHEKTITATDVAAHWHEHFRDEVSDSDKILNEQAICFFPDRRKGADLGTLVIGRRGMSTRFEFDSDAARAFVDRMSGTVPQGLPVSVTTNVNEEIDNSDINDTNVERVDETRDSVRSNRVFITHAKNMKILDQVKQIVMFRKI